MVNKGRRKRERSAESLGFVASNTLMQYHIKGNFSDAEVYYINLEKYHKPPLSPQYPVQEAQILRT